MGILHQAIGEYAKSLNKIAQEEWSKIQGRFLDLPFSVGVDEVLQLIGQAIEGPAANTVQKINLSSQGNVHIVPSKLLIITI